LTAPKYNIAIKTALMKNFNPFILAVLVTIQNCPFYRKSPSQKQMELLTDSDNPMIMYILKYFLNFIDI